MIFLKLPNLNNIKKKDYKILFGFPNYINLFAYIEQPFDAFS